MQTSTALLKSAVAPAPGLPSCHWTQQGCTVPALVHCSAKADGHALTLHSSGAHESQGTCINDTKDSLLNSLVLVHWWVSQNCNNQWDSSWQVTMPRALHRQMNEIHPHSSYLKGSLTCPGASSWGTGFRYATYLENTEVLSGNTGWGTQSLFSPQAPLQLPCTSNKGAYTLVWSNDLSNYHSRDTSRSPCPNASRIVNFGSTKTCGFENQLGLTLGKLESYRKWRLCS